MKVSDWGNTWPGQFQIEADDGATALSVGVSGKLEVAAQYTEYFEFGSGRDAMTEREIAPEMLAEALRRLGWAVAPPAAAPVAPAPPARSATHATPAEPEKLGATDALTDALTLNARLETERAGWQETAEIYCDNAGRRFNLLKRIHAACGRAISGDHDKKSMLNTLQLCAGMAADETNPRSAPSAGPSTVATKGAR